MDTSIANVKCLTIPGIDKFFSLHELIEFATSVQQGFFESEYNFHSNEYTVEFIATCCYFTAEGLELNSLGPKVWFDRIRFNSKSSDYASEGNSVWIDRKVGAKIYWKLLTQTKNGLDIETHLTPWSAIEAGLRFLDKNKLF